MNTHRIFTFFSVISFFFIQQIAAFTLLDERNFNVTLNLSKAHYLIVSDLDFRIPSSSEIDEYDLPIESTTGKVAAYSDASRGYFVTISSPNPRHISDDGYSFLMMGNNPENKNGVSFILNSSYNPDGLPAPGGSRQIYPGDTLIESDGSCDGKKVVIDLWATLTDNNEIFELPTDFYNTFLTIKQFSNH